MRIIKSFKSLALTVSILINIVFMGLYVYTNKAFIRQFISELKNGPSPKTNSAPSYWMHKDVIFKGLPNEDGEIIFLGDSHFENYQLSEFYKDTLIKNRGIMGDDSNGILHRLDEVLESKPSKVFLMVGVNDLLNGISPDSIVSTYDIILQSITEESIETKVFVHALLPTTWNMFGTNKSIKDMIPIVNEKLEALCKNRNITFIDMYDDFAIDGKLKEEYNAGDNLHITGLAYQYWSDYIKVFVNDN